MDNRLSHEDAINELHKYKAINKQLTNELAAKSLKISELENWLTEATLDMDNVRDECFKWKCMALKIRDIEQTPSTDILDAMISGMDELLAIPPLKLENTEKRRKKPELRVFVLKQEAKKQWVHLAEIANEGIEEKPVVNGGEENDASAGQENMCDQMSTCVI